MRLLRVLMFLFDVTLLPLLGFTAESSLTCTPSSPGLHSLHYSLTVLWQDGFVQPSFSAEGRLDGQAFLHYDRGKGRAEPQGPWAEDFAAEMWDTEIKDLTENGRDLRQLLAETMSLQEDKGGLHSLQETVGCEIREDGQARGFRSICYDGKLFLSCHPETHGCRVPQSLDQTLAMKIKKSWDTDGFQSKHYWAHVQGELCARLRSYVESRMGFTDRTVAWLQDEDPVSQDAQQSGGVLPDGNGTYWTWVTVNIPQGEEQRFTCHVDHSGNHSAHPVSSGNTLMHWSPWLTLAAVVVCIFIMF
ncbi:MHC class I polypeptide-related sequence B isoform X1 [Camelus dromedarius]|uniref:MHC class I polypeptide-related sequence B n=1 Tax=Camelus ferus TaxID=419612 RepID=A0A8B8RNK2_CAMFR|nr:MHC class I polypeptide-related sequence B [Camelus ferus]XP_032319388.1 MHC class I polypeptide-related sequence B [Camelus ferus]